MKAMKRAFALALAVVMTLALGTAAFAAETTYSITITNASGTYTAYQVFAGDLSEKDGTKTLSNVSWGSGVNEFTYKEKTDAAEIAKTLEGADAASADAFAAKAAENVKGSGYSAAAENGTAVLSDLPAGYYVVLNTNVSSDGSVSKYIMQVVSNVTVANKADVPTLEKKVQDNNDSTGSTSGWQDSADYDIGDAVPFQLTGTVAANYADYETYYFTFHDKEEEGLTFNADSVKVTIDGNETDAYTLVTDGLSDGCTFHVVFSDLKTTAAAAGSKIVVTYTSTLNSDAKLGSEGNLNGAKLQFSNNPNDDQKGENGPTGETPWDNVLVFTYKVVVNKYANEVKDGNELTGAEFTLTKTLSDGTAKTIDVVKADNGYTFTFKGLDEGSYTLTETVTPAGYNTISPVTFTVSADHAISWNGETRTDVLTSLTASATGNALAFAGDVTTGSLSTNVVNNSGSVLPSTGGMGTTLFYVLGGLMVAAAGVLLVTKKRMSKAD